MSTLKQFFGGWVGQPPLLRASSTTRLGARLQGREDLSGMRPLRRSGDRNSGTVNELGWVVHLGGWTSRHTRTTCRAAMAATGVPWKRHPESCDRLRQVARPTRGSRDGTGPFEAFGPNGLFASGFAGSVHRSGCISHHMCGTRRATGLRAPGDTVPIARRPAPAQRPSMTRKAQFASTAATARKSVPQRADGVRRAMRGRGARKIHRASATGA